MKSKSNKIGAGNRNPYPTVGERVFILKEYFNSKSITQIPIYGIVSEKIRKVELEDNENFCQLNDGPTNGGYRLNVNAPSKIDIDVPATEDKIEELTQICIDKNTEVAEEALKRYEDITDKVNPRYAEIDRENPDYEEVYDELKIILNPVKL